MAESPKAFEHESLQDRDSILRYLHAIGEAIQQGKVSLASNSTKFVLETPPLLKFDVRARQKSDSAQIVLKISWKKPKKGSGLHVEPLVIESEHTEQ